MTNDAERALANLNAQVSAGTLRFEKDAAERAAQHLDELARNVRAQSAGAHDASTVDGFGGFQSGADLRGGFETKVGKAVEHLDAYATAVERMAETFRAAGAAYADQDEACAKGIPVVEGTPS